jgi:large repetitive protein
VTLQASASDNAGVARVEYQVNEAPLPCAPTTPPYSCEWAVPAVRGKAYRIRSIAYDRAGNTGASQVVNVTSR